MWGPLVPMTKIKNKNLAKVKFWAPWGLLFGAPSYFFINYVILVILMKSEDQLPCTPQKLAIYPVLQLGPTDQYS